MLIFFFFFQILKDDSNQSISEDYVALVPRQPVYVKHKWLNHVQASFKGKSKKVTVKNLISRIYEPVEVQQHTALGKALRGNNINYSYFIQSNVKDLVEMLGVAVILMILFY